MRAPNVSLRSLLPLIMLGVGGVIACCHQATSTAAASPNVPAQLAASPQASPVAKTAEGQAAPAPKATAKTRSCTSSANCGSTEHCSTEDGVCLPPPDCKPGQMCAEVCNGTCVPTQAPPTSCRTNADCQTLSNYCEGCRCEAGLKGAPQAPCKGHTAACLVDPCFKQQAICKDARCLLAPR